MKIVKDVIAKIIMFLDINDEQSIPKLRVLREQLSKNNKMVLKGVANLTKVIE